MVAFLSAAEFLLSKVPAKTEVGAEVRLKHTGLVCQAQGPGFIHSVYSNTHFWREKDDLGGNFCEQFIKVQSFISAVPWNSHGS